MTRASTIHHVRACMWHAGEACDRGCRSKAAPTPPARADSDAVWTMRDGTRIRVRDMADSHLLNTIRFVERAADRKRAELVADGYAAMASLNGEMAQYICEGEIHAVEASAPGEFFPIYDDMVDEAVSRGLSLDNSHPALRPTTEAPR